MSKLTYAINGNEMIEKSAYDSLSAQNEINRCAAENSQRRIHDLNARVAEFEEIKKQHLIILEAANERIAELEEAGRGIIDDNFEEHKKWEQQYDQMKAKLSVGEAEIERLKSINQKQAQVIQVTDANYFELNSKLAVAVEAVEFIASGCLVPPDGGSPRFEDAIQEAREALAKIRGEK